MLALWIVARLQLKWLKSIKFSPKHPDLLELKAAAKIIREDVPSCCRLVIYSLEGMNPNPSTFTSLLNACARLGVSRQGKQIHTAIIKMAFESDVFVSNVLIAMSWVSVITYKFWAHQLQNMIYCIKILNPVWLRD